MSYDSPFLEAIALRERLTELERLTRAQEEEGQLGAVAGPPPTNQSTPNIRHEWTRHRQPPPLRPYYEENNRTYVQDENNTQRLPEDTTRDNTHPNPIGSNRSTEEALASFATSMSQILSRFTEISKVPPPERPTLAETYSGVPEEDPERFIMAVERYFEKIHLFDDDERLNKIRYQLQGEAKQWSNSIRHLPMSYTTFKQRFMDEFDSPRRRVVVYSMFFSQHQGEKEKAEKFVTTKQALLPRIKSHMGAETEVEMVISLLQPAIASRIVGTRPRSLEELIQIVRQIEPDVVREYGTFSAKAETKTATAAVIPPRINQPPNPCRWCSGNHYNNNCPQNPYRQTQGNAERAVRVAPSNPLSAQATNTTSTQARRPLREGFPSSTGAAEHQRIGL